MKIQCDVCAKKEATLFCTADEAALCEGCDKRVHHANKLASKHPRFSLLHPSSFCTQSHAPPLCDICQERRAFLFCREDRAILCRECDIPIHKANEHTQKHDRFLLTGVKLSSSSSPYPNRNLTGVKLSSSSSPYPNPCPPSFNGFDSSLNQRTTSVDDVPSYDHDIFSQFSYNSNSNTCMGLTAVTTTTTDYNQISEEVSFSTSNSVSEYLMETMPGWRLEDLLEPSSVSHHNFYF